MKVLCIDNKPRKNSAHPEKLKLIQEGDTYVVCHDFVTVDKYDNAVRAYSLEGLFYPYLADRFIPLYNIDETELIQERVKELA